MFDSLTPLEAFELETVIKSAHRAVIEAQRAMYRLRNSTAIDGVSFHYSQKAVRYSSMLSEQTRIMIDLRNRKS